MSPPFLVYPGHAIATKYSPRVWGSIERGGGPAGSEHACYSIKTFRNHPGNEQHWVITPFWILLHLLYIKAASACLLSKLYSVLLASSWSNEARVSHFESAIAQSGLLCNAMRIGVHLYQLGNARLEKLCHSVRSRQKELQNLSEIHPNQGHRLC